eukprot:TRINITY_DN12023_c0_g1_i10.p1 TRINITY_DN12023_c0_g1~~TRINITY_DN12023_c0_g1_i10.p1  ORF type:complete len:216 (-),score=15.71 TRINITY_DN12023_c0_g1_i10:981-1628(-)
MSDDARAQLANLTRLLEEERQERTKDRQRAEQAEQRAEQAEQRAQQEAQEAQEFKQKWEKLERDGTAALNGEQIGFSCFAVNLTTLVPAVKPASGGWFNPSSETGPDNKSSPTSSNFIHAESKAGRLFFPLALEFLRLYKNAQPTPDMLEAGKQLATAATCLKKDPAGPHQWSTGQRFGRYFTESQVFPSVLPRQDKRSCGRHWLLGGAECSIVR